MSPETALRHLREGRVVRSTDLIGASDSVYFDGPRTIGSDITSVDIEGVTEVFGSVRRLAKQLGFKPDRKLYGEQQTVIRDALLITNGEGRVDVAAVIRRDDHPNMFAFYERGADRAKVILSGHLATTDLAVIDHLEKDVPLRVRLYVSVGGDKDDSASIAYRTTAVHLD